MVVCKGCNRLLEKNEEEKGLCPYCRNEKDYNLKTGIKFGAGGFALGVILGSFIKGLIGGTGGTKGGGKSGKGGFSGSGGFGF